MNHYGHLAQRYWTDYLTSRVARMSDPEQFFTEMGQRVQSEIDTIYTAMTKTVPANLPPEQIEGWKNMARTMAEEKVLAELVYLDPDSGPDEASPLEEAGWRDRWPDTIVTDTIQESYDTEAGPTV